MTALHPQRGGTSGVSPKRGVVVHDSEGGEGGSSSANLLAYLASPGDRPNGHGGFYGAGYHAVATETGGYVQIAGADRSPYHAPPLNSTWWSICIPGRAAQTREQWLDAASRPYIAGVARFIVDVWHIDGEAWPLTLRRANELVDGEQGIASHAEVSKAWHLTDHWDPGPAFPWDVLAADIAAIVAPPVEEHPIVIEPPAPTTPPAAGGDLMMTLFKPIDADAWFYGQVDARGIAHTVEWTGDGGDARVGQRLAEELAAGCVVNEVTSIVSFRNCVHLGELPPDGSDGRHQWRDNDFARVIR